MKTSFLASLAFAAVLVPSLASAASTLRYDPSAGNNDPRFVENVFDASALKADAGVSQAQPANATVATVYDPSAGNNDPRFASALIVKDSANAAAAKADADRYAQTDAVIGTHGSAGYRVVTKYDPSAGNNDPRFVDTVVVGN